MKILIVNAGSSSLKYQLVDMDGEKLMAKGLVERIGIEGSKLTQKVNGQEIVFEQPIKDHTEACSLMIKALTDPEKGAVKHMDEIGAVGHRVLHGGEAFTASVLINEEVKDAIRANIPLGPLHNPANLMGIEACEKVMPGTPNVAVFDTAFHQTMPPKAYLYGVPYEYYERLHVRRYGFHGTSHRYVSKRVCEFLGLDRSKTRVITCHLGNGSSMAAVDCGKCVDTSMGITPLEGVIMGTRSGSMDPAVVQYIANNDHMTVDEVLNMCNKKSGLLGISGLSSDMRDIDAAADSGHERAIIARRGGRRGAAREGHGGIRVHGRQARSRQERRGQPQGKRHLCRRQQGQDLRHPHGRGNRHRPGYPVHRDRQADRIKGNPVGQACRQPQITARHACFFLGKPLWGRELIADAKALSGRQSFSDRP